MNYLNYFDAAYYINLDRRIERKKLIENRFKQINLNVERFSAITPDINDSLIIDYVKNDPRCVYKIGCTLSHMEIVKRVKQMGCSNVLIFEDDCVFDDNFISKINLCITELKIQKWDLFYMGGEISNYCIYLSEHLRLCSPHGGVYGTHAYAINNSFYDKVLNINPYQPNSIDIIYLHQIDRNYIVCKELLVTQDDSESDLWGGIINRTEHYKTSYNRYIN